MVIKTTFLPNVCQLVSLIASPKHPQSLIGLNRARYSVKRVIPPINITVPQAICRLQRPIKRHPPMINSIEQRATERTRAIGLRLDSPMVLKYSPILIAPPTGSTPLTNPENSSKATNRILESSAKMYWTR